MSTCRERTLGTLADLGALRFHRPKNVISCEGGAVQCRGAVLCRDAEMAERARNIRPKGTDRS